MRVVIALLFIVTIAACGSGDNGGPCTYDTDSVGATIVRMDSTNTPYPDIILTVPSTLNGTDTLRYTNVTNESPTWEVAAERGYKVGAQLMCIRQVRTSGACTPEIFVVSTHTVER
jgi:hypothetical protein